MADSEDSKKQRSPLQFLTGRRRKVLKDKRKHESGFSDGDYDKIIAEEPDDIISAPESLQTSAGAKSKSRLGKVFNKYRKIRKSASAPITPSAKGSSDLVAELAPSTSLDDSESLTSSYRTPYEGTSSGYSTPVPFDNNGHDYGGSSQDFEHSEGLADDTVMTQHADTLLGEATPLAADLDEIPQSGKAEAIDADDDSHSTPTEALQADEAPAVGYPPKGLKSDDEDKPLSSSDSSLSAKLSWDDPRARLPASAREPRRSPAPATRYEFVTGQLISAPADTSAAGGGGARPKTSYATRPRSSEVVPSYVTDADFEIPEELREKVGDKPIEIINRMELPPKSGDANGRQRQERLYKVLVIGDLGTGKTSIIKRYVHQFFSQHYRATIGVDFALKVIQWDQDIAIRLQLWDIAGQERYGNMTRVYYKEAVGAFIVFDVSRMSTFEAVTRWKNDLDAKVQLPDGTPVPCVLLANKCDQAKEGNVEVPSKLDQFCKDNGFLGWFETSAKDNVNIDEAVKFLVGKILQNDKLSTSGRNGETDTLSLEPSAREAESAPKKSGCC